MVSIVGSSGPTSSGNFTSTAIAGLAAGDLMFLAFSDDGETSQAGLSSDWTEIYDVTSPVGTTSACALHYRIATGTAADAATYDNSVYGSAVVFAFRSSTGVFDFTPGTDVAWSGTTTRTPASISNDSADNTAVIIAHVQDTPTNPTLPSGFSSTGNNSFGSGSSASSTTVAHKIGSLSTPTEAPGQFTGVNASPNFLRCTTIILREGSASGVTADADITEAGDTVSAAATVDITADAAITEAGDTAAGEAGLAISADASILEAGDTVSSTAGPVLSAEADVQEEGDSVAASAQVSISADTAIDEAGDTTSASAVLSIEANAGLTEGGDSTASTATLDIDGSANLLEAGDTVAGTGTLAVIADADITEEGDSLSAEGGDPAISPLTYVDSTANTANQTVYTFTDHPIGESSTDRVVVVCVHGRGESGADLKISGLSVGGSAASQFFDFPQVQAYHAGIWFLEVASGTTADIVVTFDGPSEFCKIDVYALTGLANPTPLFCGVNESTGEGDLMDATSDGVAIACITSDSFSDFSGVLATDSNTTVDGHAAACGSGIMTEADITYVDGYPYVTVESNGVTSSGYLMYAAWDVLSTVDASARITEAGDIVSATATTDIAASAGIVETGDEVASDATLAITADAALVESSDGVSSAATIDVAANADIAEAGDSAASTATLGLSADANVVEAGDSASAGATVDISASAGINEAGDTAQSAGTLLIEANAAITEGGDTLSASGGTQPITTADADIREAGDSVSAEATLAIDAQALIDEVGDTVAAAAALTILADAAIIEGGDSVSAIIERVYASVPNRRIRFITETPGARTIEFVTDVIDERPIIFVEPPAPRIIEWLRV